jgi:peptide/nickel transport system substrate-binding protein
VPYEVETLDPHARDQLGANAVTANFYEPLVTTNAALEIQPCLARRWENPDPLTWVFHLRSGVRFHSGKTLDAGDIVYTFNRLLKNPALGISSYAQSIVRVEAVDPLTVRLRTDKPVNILLNKLRFISIVPSGATAAELAKKPDGTGPYRFAAWKRNDFVRLIRNERYWGPRPAFGEVMLYLDRTPEAAVHDLLTGRSGLARCNTRNIEALAGDAARFRVVRRTSLATMYLGYDMSRPVTPYAETRTNPFKSKLVRKAIDTAIDRKALVARLTHDAVPAAQLVPPFIFGFNPKIAPAAYDPEAARLDLARAGFPDGFSVTLDARKTMGEAAENVREQLARIGIRVRVVDHGAREFYERARAHDLSFYLTGFACPTGDLSDLLDEAMHSPDRSNRLGLNNYMGYADPAMDRAIEESATLASVDQRRVRLQQIMASLMDELVWIPLYVDEDVYAVDRSLDWEPRSDSFVIAAEVSRKTP